MQMCNGFVRKTVLNCNPKTEKITLVQQNIKMDFTSNRGEINKNELMK